MQLAIWEYGPFSKGRRRELGEGLFLALKLPNRNRLPPELEEALIIVEIGFPPQVIDEWPQGLIEKILIYKGVKNVVQFGGNWQP
ncbi:hypothetical protein ES703_63733 [subsurface metagenome]